jgi:hypothetical protein
MSELTPDTNRNGITLPFGFTLPISAVIPGTATIPSFVHLVIKTEGPDDTSCRMFPAISLVAATAGITMA